jgi:signal transduction histidine kinase
MVYQNDEKVIEVVQRINSSVKKGTQLVDGLLHFSRKQAKKESEVVDLCVVINEMYRLIKESFKKITIHLNIPESLKIKGNFADIS